MNRQQIIDIMHQPALLNEATLPELRMILDEYPFFQVARMLWIKNLNMLDHFRFNNEVKLAAIHIPNRTRLYNLLYNTEETKSFEPVMAAEETATATSKPQTEPSDSKNSAVVVFDYFDVNDTYDTPFGETIDFSSLQLNENETQGSVAEEEQMVLPSADLLDYERTDAEFFSLSESDEDLNLDEYRSFSAWLKALHQHAVPASDAKKHTNRLPGGDKRDLIDNFLMKGAKSKIRVVPDNEKTVANEDLSVKAFQESDDLLTETLANIYIRQKHFSKALEIFERLRLKYPEKNIYFAGRIKELEEQINNQ